MYKPKTCPICGDVFTVKSARQKYCNKLVIRNCMICGKEYESKCNPTYNKCCSKKCQTIYTHQQQVAGYSDKRAICKLCGKEFTPVNNTQIVCSDTHYLTCEVCGKEFLFEFKQSADIPKTCSRECATKLAFKGGNPFQNPECQEKAKRTMLDKYGVEHPMHSEEIRKKLDDTMMERYGVRRYTQTPQYVEEAKATNQQKYGVDWPIQSDVFKEKSKNTLFEHFGVHNTMHSPEIVEKRNALYKEKTGYENPLQNPEVREKGKQKLLELYGVDHPSKSPEILRKISDTMEERYGVPYVLQSPELVAKIQATNKRKYGYENAASSPIVQKKISDTMQKKYGSSRYSGTDDWLLSMMTDPNQLDNLKEFRKDPREFISSHFSVNPTLQELYDLTGVGHECIMTVLSKFHCTDLVSFKISSMENEVINALLAIDPNLNITQRTRKIISPYEIDIYLPDYKIGIECNPTVTHNSSMSFILAGNDREPTPRRYHKMKTDLCESNGVFLFHIFGYEWKYNRDIIISMLRNLLGKNQYKIFARNTYISQIDAPTCAQFLNENHRQGRVLSPIRLGLYTKDTNELVSVMTFGKLRRTMGTNKQTDADIWELTRFCNKQNTTVVGGASKLFRYFINTNLPKEVRSFSDRSHTRGNLYHTLGFIELQRSDASYVWVNLKTDEAFHRINAQKRNLKRFLNDPNIDIENNTENQIMEAHNFVSVYDSGTITWQWLA